MLNWIKPNYSKSRVKLAGKRIRDNAFTGEDIEVMENFRASHAYILNTFQSTLRNRSRYKSITVAQRLKRRNTIFDKLRREPHMQLSTMHDIAGCRLIFQSQEDLVKFRSSLHNARFKHKLLFNDTDKDKYNYIIKPKESGYRGIHDVYEYHVSSTSGPIWNGLRIEIQYRTIYQHAWATAVEVADLITTSRIKFSEADEYHRIFFQLASEMIARSFEHQNSCLKDISNIELVHEFEKYERKIGLMRAFSHLEKTNSKPKFKKNTLLIYITDTETNKKRLEIETFDTVNKAIQRYEELEKKYGDNADTVLVRAENEESIRDAFRNYFSDTNEFTRYIKSSREILARYPRNHIVPVKA
jgi:putative GTP pyrophosphokinase